MASATTTATSYIRRRDITSSSALAGPKIKSDNFLFCFPSKTLRRFHIIKTSSDVTAETTATTEAEAEAETEEEIEVQKEFPSVISYLNLEKAIRGISITDTDYYGVLGLQQGCSYDEVTVAYKNKLENMTDKEADQDDELSKKLELLKEAYTILSTEDERRLYDWSLARSANPGRYTWPFEVDITQASTSTDIPPTIQEPEDPEPTKYLGYFFLTWMMLAAALSVAFNR